MKRDNCVILHKQTDVLAIQAHQIREDQISSEFMKFLPSGLFFGKSFLNSELVYFIQQLGNLAILDQRSVVSLTQ